MRDPDCIPSQHGIHVYCETHGGTLETCDRLTALAASKDAEIAALKAEVEAARRERDEAKRAKDGAYSERDKCVAAFATCAYSLGWPVWLAVHEGEWDDDWRNIVFIQTPFGQASWHYHDSEREWFSWIGLCQPATPPRWDGHSTPEKYERLFGIVHNGIAHPAVIELRRVLGHALHLTSEMGDWNATVGCESDAPGDSTCLDMGIDPCGPCKIGRAAEELEALLRGKKSNSFESRAETAESLAAELAAVAKAAEEMKDVLRLEPSDGGCAVAMVNALAALSPEARKLIEEGGSRG